MLLELSDDETFDQHDEGEFHVVDTIEVVDQVPDSTFQTEVTEIVGRFTQARVIESSSQMRTVSRPWHKYDGGPPADDSSQTHCDVCLKQFKSPSALFTHNCKGFSEKRDLVSYLVKRLASLTSLQAIRVVDSKSAEFAVDFESALPPWKYEAGWARRPARGHTYGARYIRKYKDEISIMVLEGNENKAKQMNPTQILATLKDRHEGEFAFPSVAEVSKSGSTNAPVARKVGGVTRPQYMRTWLTMVAPRT
ncbi:hypothetical protein H257_19584 [Aphanomyces astaci]|uniref:Uncharacterized protein n=1 Tax=Aphanomyces astaci TaxID=112090 RepID=W4F9I0_APHAT|nr:hypothetical protein H257_19583 [Aphanomyces astaci]XP_009847020.1 hypothetical protein H257_19584 [Aphanomyces astaci]ETV63496.1 hypothetical protein H257_19584 [Aphanomyces astaci]ETV63497.1 hypothetical protein H257_19583 [Aphanomyces astaci]|eukprot:XP_009847019.1 hypothetical protein H257_19583 [Aphanomyces astaci]